MVARTHAGLGHVVQAGQVATGALAAASQAGDTWAMGWALHVQSVVVGSQGHVTDALSLFDQALAVTGADPALDDLRLLLQLNKSVALAQLDRCAEALAAAEQARDLADQIGTVVRAGQAHCALGQLLFDSGAGTMRWPKCRSSIRV